MGSFTLDLNRAIDRTMQKADQALRKIALETYAKVQSKTPVDSGQLRRSWTVAINAPPTNYDGSQTALLRAKFGDTIVIATNKLYAPILEYGLYPNPPNKPTGKTRHGYSVQAPLGMVRITVQEMQAWLANNPTIFS